MHPDHRDARTRMLASTRTDFCKYSRPNTKIHIHPHRQTLHTSTCVYARTLKCRFIWITHARRCTHLTYRSQTRRVPESSYYACDDAFMRPNACIVTPQEGHTCHFSVAAAVSHEGSPFLLSFLFTEHLLPSSRRVTGEARVGESAGGAAGRGGRGFPSQSSPSCPLLTQAPLEAQSSPPRLSPEGNQSWRIGNRAQASK